MFAVTSIASTKFGFTGKVAPRDRKEERLGEILSKN